MGCSWEGAGRRWHHHSLYSAKDIERTRVLPRFVRAPLVIPTSVRNAVREKRRCNEFTTLSVMGGMGHNEGC